MVSDYSESADHFENQYFPVSHMTYRLILCVSSDHYAVSFMGIQEGRMWL